MLWLLPLALGVAGLIALVTLGRVVHRELRPTLVAIDRFGREHRTAIDGARKRLADGTATARRRLSQD